MIAAQFAHDQLPQAAVPSSSFTSMNRTYERRAEDYTHDALNTFTFGNPSTSPQPSSSSSSLSVDHPNPLDVTPRPSVAGPLQRIPQWRKSATVDNDEENNDHFTNPSSPMRASPDPSSAGSTHEDRLQVEFSSDDEYSYEEDFDEEDGVEDRRLGGTDEMEGLTSIQEGQLPSAADLRAWRRGSLPVPAVLNIGTSSRRDSQTTPTDIFNNSRDREASVATLRRPSKSLERLRDPIPAANDGPIVFSSPFASSGSPTFTTPTQSVDPKSTAPPESSTASESLGFDLAYITQGITSFSETVETVTPTASSDPHANFTEFVARRPSLTPSTASGSKSPKWWNSWGFPRRHSAVSTGSGEHGDRINGGSMFVYDDSFSKGLVRWGGEGYKEQRQEWCFRRVPDVDKPVATDKTPEDEGTQSSASSLAESNVEEKEKEKLKAKERTKEREKRAPENWRGMPVASEELWRNELVGTFAISREEIVRQGSEHTGKGPQQRLVIRGSRKHRHPDGRRQLPHPPVIVHRHSKALAFSLSRYYKPHHPTGIADRTSTSTHGTDTSSTTRRTSVTGRASTTKSMSSGLAEVPSRSAARVILLAPRKVQEAFTSTTTTKMLAEHGLLKADDSRRRNSATATTPSSGEGPTRRRRRSNSAGVSPRSGSAKTKRNEPTDQGVPPLPPPPSTAPVAGTRSLGPSSVEVPVPPPTAPASSSSLAGSIRTSSSTTAIDKHPVSMSSADNTSISASSSTPSHTHNGDDESYDSQDNDHNPTSSNYSSSTGDTSMSEHNDEPDDDTDYEDAPKTLFRTTHRETYGTVDINAVERHQALLHQASQSDGRSGIGLFDRLRSRNTRSPPGAFGIAQPFDPPWMTFEPRGKQEQQKRVVDNLNMSFKDVGLLPSTPRDRTVGKGKRKNGPTPPNAGLKGRKKRDVFENIPVDSLYMLLPLWPGDTDHHSHRNYPFIEPHIPIERRKFLLVYYKPLDAKEQKKHMASGKSSTTTSKVDPKASVASSKSKKLGSRISSTSSVDSRYRDEKKILLPGFLVIARQVSYADLQGSGVRIPEEGLAISGPMEDAYRQMPFSISEDYSALGRRRASWSSSSDEYHGGMFDFVLGACYSREAGVEFDPEGLVALGLCTVLNPLPIGVVAEEWSDQGTKMHQVKLTPMGMAVMEMAWIGGIALNSFGPG